MSLFYHCQSPTCKADGLVCPIEPARISEAVGFQWRDIDYENSQINVRRRWIRGNIDKPKSMASKAPVAMAPLLAEWLRAWQKESVHSKPEDWIFASVKTNGRTPRVGNMLVADHLRPAAAKSGVFKNGVPKRFGFQSRASRARLLDLGQRIGSRRNRRHEQGL